MREQIKPLAAPKAQQDIALGDPKASGVAQGLQYKKMNFDAEGVAGARGFLRAFSARFDFFAILPWGYASLTPGCIPTRRWRLGKGRQINWLS